MRIKFPFLFMLLVSTILQPVFGQDNKTVTLIVSGRGITLDEAKQSALRNAIEQAFGAFISTKTEILNDELVKDEIVSVSSGNIQKFEVISEVQIPDAGYAATLKATVSVTKLTSFVESMGVEIDFKGALFAFNIKQQILNEENELKAIKNMSLVLKSLIDKSIDYSLITGTPIAKDADNLNWSIPFLINVTANKNFFNIYNYLFQTLSGLSLTELEVNDYIVLKKHVYEIFLDEPKISFDEFVKRFRDRNNERLNPYNKRENKMRYNGEYYLNPQGLPTKAIYLRKKESFELICDLMLYFVKSTLNIKIIDRNLSYGFSPEINSCNIESGFGPISFVYHDDGVSHRIVDLFSVVEKLKSYNKDYNYETIKVLNYSDGTWGSCFGRKISLLKYSESGNEIAKITIMKDFTIEQIKNLTSFKIVKN